MKCMGLLFLRISFVFISSHVCAQDRIYLADSMKTGKVTAIDSSTISYRELSNSGSTVNTKKVFLLFNGNGNFLVPNKMDFSDPQTQDLVRRFLDSTRRHFVVDQIFFTSKRAIQDTISKEDEHFIYISIRGEEHRVDKKMVAAIIYRNGQYKLLGTVPNAAEILFSSIQASYAVATTTSGIDSPGPNMINGAAIASPVAAASSKSNPDTVKKPASAKLTFEDVAGNVSKEEFKAKSLNKINQFNSYLKILCDKKASPYDQDNAVEQAVKLFVDGAIIETSSVNNDEKKHYKVHAYLDNLKNLHYDKIDITWTKVEYVSDIRLGADGKYYGAVSFEQTFRGYRDGQLVYEDVTKKTAEVELKVYDKNYLGNTISQWDVLLSDIEVMTTKNL
ncbi:MAG TPA: hypothetical protein VK622_17575 [Puia sp.]|nr:hypothetical protein [Puia sp.]